MSLSLIFQKLRSPAKRIGALELDAVIEDIAEFTNETTDHPVEGGTEVTDHVVSRPMMLTIRSIAGSQSTNPLAFLQGGERVSDAYESLKEIHDSRLPVDVVTGLDVYPNMQMIALTIPRDYRTATAVHFTAQFKQITIVDSERVDLSADAQAGVRDLAASARNAGRQSTTPASAQTGSVLSQITGVGQ